MGTYCTCKPNVENSKITKNSKTKPQIKHAKKIWGQIGKRFETYICRHWKCGSHTPFSLSFYTFFSPYTTSFNFSSLFFFLSPSQLIIILSYPSLFLIASSSSHHLLFSSSFMVNKKEGTRRKVLEGEAWEVGGYQNQWRNLSF